MSNKQEEFENRIIKLHRKIVSLTKKLPKNQQNINYLQQVIRSSSSIGANYIEATCATSKKDFANKIGISKKESRETLYWLKLIFLENEKLKDKISKIAKETKEIVKILSKSYRTLKES